MQDFKNVSLILFFTKNSFVKKSKNQCFTEYCISVTSIPSNCIIALHYWGFCLVNADGTAYFCNKKKSMEFFHTLESLEITTHT